MGNILLKRSNLREIFCCYAKLKYVWGGEKKDAGHWPYVDTWESSTVSHVKVAFYVKFSDTIKNNTLGH